MGDQSERNQERQEVSVNAFMLEKCSCLIKWIFCKRNRTLMCQSPSKRGWTLHILCSSIYKDMFNYLGLIRVMLEVEENKNPFFPSVFCSLKAKRLKGESCLTPPPFYHRDHFYMMCWYLCSLTAATPQGLEAVNLCWLSSWPLQTSLIIALNCRIPHSTDFVSFQRCPSELQL